MRQILPIFASVYRYFWRAMQGVAVSTTRAAVLFQFDFVDPKSALEVDFVDPKSASDTDLIDPKGALEVDLADPKGAIDTDFADPKGAIEFDFDLETVIWYGRNSERFNIKGFFHLL